MPAWIHDRAEHIHAENPSMPKGKAFAIATQQSHAVGKSPKGYGTPEGRATARAKYDTPKDDKKKANPGGLKSSKLAMPAELLSSLKSVAGAGPRLGGQITNVGQHLVGAGAGQVRSAARKGTLLQNLPTSTGVRPLAIERDPFGKVAFAAFLDEIEQIKQAGALGPAGAGAAPTPTAHSAPAAPATQTGGGTPVPSPAASPPNPALVGTGTLAGGGARGLPTMSPHPSPGSPNVMFTPKMKLQPPPMSAPRGR